MKKEFTLKVGETATFELESHAGGGYLWQVVSTEEGDSTGSPQVAQVKLKVGGTPYDIKTSPIGKGLPTIVEIKAMRAGTCTAVLEERRSWERDGEALNVCEMAVRIED